LKKETKELGSKGLKKEALAKMREFKETQAQFDKLISENPDILAEMYIDSEAPKKVSAPKINIAPGAPK
jgi:hypothetical protein